MYKKYTGMDPGQGDYTAEFTRNEEQERQRIEAAEYYGCLSPNMPPCMMPDGGECCEEYADLNRRYNELREALRWYEMQAKGFAKYYSIDAPASASPVIAIAYDGGDRARNALRHQGVGESQ